MNQIKTIFKICIFLTILFIGVSFFPKSVDALWVFEDKFNSDTKSIGDLNAQDNWVAHANYDVQATTKYEGDQAVSNAGSTAGNATRDITAISDGTVYIAVRFSGLINDYQVALLKGYWTATVCYLRFRSTGIIQGYISALTTLTNYVANRWYVLKFTFNDATNNDQWQIDIWDHTAQSWIYNSGWVSTQDAYTTVDRIYFSVQNADNVTSYFDTITPTDPTAITGGVPIIPEIIFFE